MRGNGLVIRLSARGNDRINVRNVGLNGSPEGVGECFLKVFGAWLELEDFEGCARRRNLGGELVGLLGVSGDG